MSIPPPSLSQFAACLIQEIKWMRLQLEQDQSAEDVASQDVYQRIQSICINLNKELKKQDFQALDQRTITDLTSFCSRCTQDIRERIHLHNDQLEKAKVAKWLKTVENLENLLTSFEQVLSHQDEINQNAFEDYLLRDEPWAHTEFTSLIHSKNPWAEEKLMHYVAQGKPFAIKLLLYEVKNGKLIIDCKDRPEIREGVFRLLDRDSPQILQDRGHDLLKLLVRNVPEKWSQEFLKELITRPSGNGFVEFLVKLWENKSPLKGWLKAELFRGFCEQKVWIMNAYYQLFFYCDFSLVKELAEQLMEEAKGNIVLQGALLCLGALLPQDNKFQPYLIKMIEVGLFCNSYYPNVEFVLQSIERLDQFIKQLEIVYPDFPSVSFPLKYHFLGLILKREQRLIDVLGSNFQMEQYQFPAISDCFPKIKQIMMGSFANLKDVSEISFRPKMAELANRLSVEGIGLLCPFMSWALIANTPPNVEYLLGEIQTGEWVRDNCVAHPSGMRLPNFICSTMADDEAWLLQARAERLKAEYGEASIHGAFYPFGAVNSEFRPFKILSYFVGEKHSLDPFHSLCFTHNEGGNCLRGEKDGAPYAIIGKDGQIFSLESLKEEIADLGFRKSDRGEWTRGKPYAPQECKLNEDDLRLFFGLDLGISPKDIHFVEQPDYHLDVSMAILNEKTVVVNDSMQALEVWKKYAEEKIPTLGFDYNSVEYQKRLELLHTQAIAFKQHEDLTASQLVEQGFNVIRIGGKFEDLFEEISKNHRTNLFNFLTVTSPLGKRIIIAMDCESFFKEHFEKMIRENIPDGDKVSIHYLDEMESRNLLARGGGVHCTMRPLPLTN